MPTTLNTRDANFAAAFAAQLAKSREQKSDVDGVVAEILADVKKRGDDAVVDYTARFDRVTRTLQAHGATVDKFIGDAVMAFWNAPRPVEDHAFQAARACLRMMAVKRELGLAK